MAASLLGITVQQRQHRDRIGGRRQQHRIERPQLHCREAQAQFTAPAVIAKVIRDPVAIIISQHGQTLHRDAIPIKQAGVTAEHPLGEVAIPLALDLPMHQHQSRRAIMVLDLHQLVVALLARLVFEGNLLQLRVAKDDRLVPINRGVRRGKEECQKGRKELVQRVLPGPIKIGGGLLHPSPHFLV